MKIRKMGNLAFDTTPLTVGRDDARPLSLNAPA